MADEFGDAFIAAAAAEQTPSETKEAAEVSAQLAASAMESVNLGKELPAAEVPPAPEVPPATAEAPPATGEVPPAPEVPPAAEAPPPAPDMAATVAQLQAELAELRKAKAPEPVKEEPPAAAPAPEMPTLDTVLNEDEKKFLKEYETDWPDVKKGEALLRKAEMAIMREEIYREVAAALRQVIGGVTPAIEGYTRSAEEAHFAAIQSKHADYSEKLVEEAAAWAAKQPPYLKQAYLQVLEQGTADEVIDLFAKFKEQTGRVAPQTPPPSTPPKPVADPAKVSALTPVTSGRQAAVSTAIDPNDFEAAWAQAAKAA